MALACGSRRFRTGPSLDRDGGKRAVDFLLEQARGKHPHTMEEHLDYLADRNANDAGAWQTRQRVNGGIRPDRRQDFG